MSSVEANQATVKKFAGGERTVPHPSQKARKFYPAEDVKQPKKVSDDSLPWNALRERGREKKAGGMENDDR